MEVTGKIIVALPAVSGTSAAGKAWNKREYVLETEDTYPKKVFFDFFGEKADQYPLAVGDKVRLSFDIESREYTGRWDTNIRGWKADKLDGTAQASPAEATAAPIPPVEDFTTGSSNDDLPF